MRSPLFSTVILWSLLQAPAGLAEPPGRVAWWRAEGDASDFAGTHAGTLAGGLGLGEGKIGQGFQFGSVNFGTKGVSVAHGGTLNLGSGGGLTVVAWIRPTATFNQFPIAEWDAGAATGLEFSISGQTAGKVGPPGSLYTRLGVGSGGTELSTQRDSIKVGVWQHVALTWDRASGSVSLYYNGFQAAVLGGGSKEPLTSGEFRIGFRPGRAIGFTGMIDEVSLFSRALEPAEVRGMFLADAPAFLTVRWVGSDQVLLSWPSSYSDFRPQQANGAGGAWSEVDGTPFFDEIGWSLVVPAPTPMGLFRLRGP